MNLKQILIILLVVFVLMIIIGQKTAATSCISINILTPVKKATPGDTLNLLFAVINNGKERTSINPEIKLPAGWKLLIPLNGISISPGMSETVIVPVLVGTNSRAGSYSLPFSLHGDKNSSKKFIINVREINRLSVTCLDYPDYAVSGQDYRVQFTVSNNGNIGEIVKFTLQDNLDFPVHLKPDKVHISPGESIIVTVKVSIPAEFHKSCSQRLQLIAESKNKAEDAAGIKVNIIPRKISAGSIYHTFPVKLTIAKNKWRLRGQGRLSKNSNTILAVNFNDRRNFLKYSFPSFTIKAGDNNLSLSPLIKLANKKHIKFKHNNGKKDLQLFYCHDKSWGVKAGLGINNNNKLSMQYLNLPSISNTNLITVKNSFKYNFGRLAVEYGQQLNEEMPAALYVKGNYRYNNFNAKLAYKKEDNKFLGEKKHKYLGFYTDFNFFNLCQTNLAFVANDDNKKLGCKLSWQNEDCYRGIKVQKSLTSSDEYKYNVFIKNTLTSKADLYQRLGLKSGDIKKHAFYNLYLYRSLTDGNFSSYLQYKYPLQEDEREDIGAGLYILKHLDENNIIRAGFNYQDLSDYNCCFYFKAIHKNNAGNILTCKGKINFDNMCQPELETELAYSIPLSIPIKQREDLGAVSGYITSSTGRGIKNAIIKLNGQSTVTDKNGYYLFPTVPTGKHYLSIIKPTNFKDDYLLIPSDLVIIDLKSNKKLNRNFHMVKSADIEGEINVVNKNIKNNVYKSSIYGQAKISTEKIYNSIIIEIIHKGKAYRKISNKKGKFYFNKLPPGKWELRVHRNGLSDLYKIKPQKKYIKLKEGEKNNIYIKVIPVKREINMQQGGTVEVDCN